MEVKVDFEWTVGDLLESRREGVLRVNHEYQRGQRWNNAQKQMFIDSIFREYSIPAFYFHRRETVTAKATNTYFDIVDGQQRTDAIYTYCENAFPLLDPLSDSGFKFPNFVKNAPCPWGGKRFGELPEDLQERLKQHKIVVYSISTHNENAIRDLFIRLQGGTPLTPQDKRDSWPGNFTEFILRVGGKSEIPKWYGLPLFREVVKAGNESRKRQLAAQVFMLFWAVRKEKKFCDIKSANIDEFYHAHVGFDEKSNEAKRFEAICEKLSAAFGEKPRKLEGHYLIHLFLLADSLIDEYVSGWEPHLAANLFEFDRRRREAGDNVRNNRDVENNSYYYRYGQWTQTRADNADTIRRRHAFFSQEMLELLNPTQLDENRNFSDLQRQTVFFRDQEICQWCRMEGVSRRVSWDDCEIHHVEPHAQGGPTEIDNAALMHSSCHPKGKLDVQKFHDWWKSAEPASPRPSRKSKRRPKPPDGTKAKFQYDGKTYHGEFRNGNLALEGDREGTVCNSLSDASREITGTARNGWRDWFLCIPGKNSWVLAADWRDES